MPWITATTATRNATDTMMPSSVKNERSLWLHAACRAWRIASVSCMAGNILPLFVSQRLHRIQLRGARRGVDPEQDARHGGCDEGEDHGADRDVGVDRGGGRDQEGDEPAREHAADAARHGERGGLHQELPQDGALRRPERLAHADL